MFLKCFPATLGGPDIGARRNGQPFRIDLSCASQGKKTMVKTVAAVAVGMALLGGSAHAQSVADLKGNWLTREPADSGGTFVTLYTISGAADRLTLRSVGIRLEDS